MESVTVSIITPCYNAENTIEETIRSVLTQTFIDWELLIIDDCSTDNSAEIIKRHVANDSRIKYFKTDRCTGSPSLPRNIGINNAKGKYIAFLDADDIWLKDKLTKQITFMEENNIDFCYSDYEKINYSGIRSNRFLKMPSKATYWDVIESCYIPCLTVVLRRSVIGSTRFKDVKKEDWVFWLDILRKRIIAINCNENLALYREQKKSRSSNKIHMIKQQWSILRKEEGIKVPVALYFMCKYIFHGISKYLK